MAVSHRGLTSGELVSQNGVHERTMDPLHPAKDRTLADRRRCHVEMLENDDDTPSSVCIGLINQPC